MSERPFAWHVSCDYVCKKHGTRVNGKWIFFTKTDAKRDLKAAGHKRLKFVPLVQGKEQ